MDDRRKTKRIALDSSLTIKRLDLGEVDQEVSIEIYDISKNGTGFQCTEILQIGSVYEATITLWTKDIINAFIEIVRIVKVEDGFDYGGIFIGMPDTDLQRIAIYDTVETELHKIVF